MSKLVTKGSLKAFRKQTDEKYVIEGEYSPSTGVGEADRLTPYGPNSGVRDNTPFLFQTSGGGSDIGSLAYFNELRGNTIKYNQKAPVFSTETKNGITATASNNGRKLTFSSSQQDSNITNFYYTLSREICSGHKFILLIDKCDVNTTDSNDPLFYFGFTTSYGGYSATTLVDPFTGILTASGDYHDFCIRIESNGNTISGSIEDVRIYDLTDMFGAGNEPADYQEFVKKSGIVSWDEPNPGELKSAKPSAYKIVGYNACDGVFKKGYWISKASGEEEYDGDTNAAIAANFIKIVPGHDYTVEVEFDDDNYLDDDYSIYVWMYDSNKHFIGTKYLSNAKPSNFGENTHYIKIGVYCGMEIDLDKTHVCCHLTWDESKTGYEEHYHETYPLPNIPLRKVGNVYDTLTHEGKLTRRVGVTNFHDLPWEHVDTADGNYRFVASVANIKAVESDDDEGNVLTELDFKTMSVDQIFDHAAMMDSQNLIGVDTNGYIHIYLGREQINSTADLTVYIETVPSTLYVYYELDEPVETTDEEYAFTYKTIIDDFGTQEFIGSDIPVGNDFFYVSDYKAFIDSVYNKMKGNAENVPTKSDAKKPKNLNNVNHNNKFKNFVTLTNGQIYSKFNINYLFNTGKHTHFHNDSWAPASECWGKPFGNTEASFTLFENGMYVPQYGMPDSVEVAETEMQSITYYDFLVEYIFPNLDTLEALQDNYKNEMPAGTKFLRPVEKAFKGTFTYDDTDRGELENNSITNPFKDYFIKDGAVHITFGSDTFRVAGRKMIKFCANELMPLCRIIASEWLDLQIIIIGDSSDDVDNTATIYIGLSKKTFR